MNGYATAQGLLRSRFQFSQDGDSGLAQNTLYYVVGQTRGVVVKMEQVFLLVITKFLKAVSIREFAQGTEMLWLEPFLQFVSSGH